MFEVRRSRHPIATTFAMAELTFNWTVRNLSTNDTNPILSVVKSLLGSVVMTLIFFGMFQVLGMRGSAVRGDFLMYLMSGILMFLFHNKTMGAVAGAPGAGDPMMKHAPLNRIIVLISASLAVFYKEFLAAVLMLFAYDAVTGNVEFYRFYPTLGMFTLAWFSGVCVGTAFLGLREHFPIAVPIAKQMYMRANMVFSGKMFLANTLPSSMLPMFDWNPLFHIIDQTRGFVFLNYNPHFSSITYPIAVCLALLVLGLIFEFGKTGTGAVTRGTGN